MKEGLVGYVYILIFVQRITRKLQVYYQEVRRSTEKLKTPGNAGRVTGSVNEIMST